MFSNFTIYVYVQLKKLETYLSKKKKIEKEQIIKCKIDANIKAMKTFRNKIRTCIRKFANVTAEINNVSVTYFMSIIITTILLW